MTTHEPNLIWYRLVVPPEANEPQATFTWAAYRVLDAADRMRQLESLLQEHAAEWGKHVQLRARADNPGGSIELNFEGVRAELAVLARPATTLASEVIHHLRAALDYCAHNAAWMDGGTRNEDTQFPLADTPAKWRNAARGKWLKGVSAEHKQWIDAVQPYRGVAWTTELKRLSNHDKHRVTVQVVPAYVVGVDRNQLTGDPLGDSGYVGFQDHERRIELLIADAFTVDDPVEATALLWQMLKGVVTVVNQFLVVEGLEQINVQDKTAES